jgi:hypothetical protein
MIYMTYRPEPDTEPPDRPALAEYRERQFSTLWTAWGFGYDGLPEDAASYLYEVLLAVRRDAPHYGRRLEAIGNMDGQQEFVLNSVRSMGLIDMSGPEQTPILTNLGNDVLGLMEDGTYLRCLFNETKPVDEHAERGALRRR